MLGRFMSADWVRIVREATKTILGGAAAGQMLSISDGGPSGYVGSWIVLLMVILGYGLIEMLLGKPKPTISKPFTRTCGQSSMGDLRF